jgi:hypothetical protein
MQRAFCFVAFEDVRVCFPREVGPGLRLFQKRARSAGFHGRVTGFGIV